MDLNKTFIGRQPILDENSKLVGYELLFRKSGDATKAEINDPFTAIIETLVNALDYFGIDVLVGNGYGFINVNKRVLMSPIIELLPSKRFILEILEDVTIDKELIERLEDLRSNGYLFALDDFIFKQFNINALKNVEPFIDIIKVDLLNISEEEIIRNTKYLKKTNCFLLAEKVENREQYELCKFLGYDYFQGFYFEKPETLEARKIDPQRMGILRLINLINRDSNIKKIVDTFNLYPDLSVNLLKFINSAAFYLRNEVKSIQHAISLIGMKKLLNWLIMLSYVSKNNFGLDSPLFQMVAVKAKTMEILCSDYLKRSDCDSAFLAGLLSNIDVLFSMPKERLLNEISVSEEIKRGVLHYEGFIGELLKIVEQSDKEEDITEIENNLGLTLEQITDAKLKSYKWFYTLIREL
ncbi:EAL domain-containing protein [Deferribacter autotrophicus]|uniref:EAL domain-containing protein n=1 Tax=Deferribacter autotrophicus TaxID=500465 RepID=A0A5A8F7C1_9BACT|nr:EAL domain-containing protein [Deferribacter autotrophicus]KAA0259503.1 EAL domain-containing protein [Deferribacter autotrophicus]